MKSHGRDHQAHRRIAATVEALGLEPIFEVLDKLGLPKEPPMQSKAPGIDLPRIAGMAQRTLGLNFLIHFYISEDIRDTTRNRMMVRIRRSRVNELTYY